jgi:hypothetical protein
VVLVSLVALRNMHELQWNLGEMRATLCNFTHTNFFHFPTFRLFSISLPINYRLSDSSFLRKSLWIVLLLNPVSQRRPQKAAWQQTNCSKISCTKQSRVIFLSFPDHLYELLPSVALLLFSEVFVDWVKHAFITKFNCISSEVRTARVLTTTWKS